MHKKSTYLVLLLFITSCVSSKKYSSQKHEADQLRLEMNTIQEKIAQVDKLNFELTDTKDQLRKTEEVLTQFYMKYEGKEPSYNFTTSKSISNEFDQLKFDSLIQKLNSIQVDLNFRTSENEKLKNDIQFIQSNNKKSSTENSTIVNLENKISTLNSEILVLNQTVKDQQLKLTTLDDIIKNTPKNQDSPNLKLQGELIAKNQEIETLNRSIKFKDEQMSNLLKDKQTSSTKTKDKKSNVENTELKTQLSEKSLKITELENELNNIKMLAIQKDIQLEDLKKQNTIASSKHETLNNEIAEQNSTILKLQSEIESIKNNPSDKKGKVKELQSQVKQLQESLTSKEKTYSQLQQELNQANNSKTQTEQELTQLKATLANKNQELEKAKQINQSTKDINTSIANYQSRLEQNEIKINNLQSIVDSKEKIISTLELNATTNSDAKVKLENTQKQLAENNALIAELKKSNELKTKEIDQINNLLSQSQIENKKLISTNATKNQTDQSNEIAQNELKSQKADLEGKLSNFQYTVNQQNKKIDSLEFVASNLQSKLELESIALSNANSKLSINEYELSKLRSDVNAKSKNNEESNKIAEQANEITRLNNRINELLKSNAIASTSKSNTKSLPSPVVNKISGLSNEYPKAGVFYKLENGKIHVLIPQSYLFEGETVALKEQGSQIINSIGATLKNHPTLTIHLTGFGSYESNATKTMDGSYRRANTVLRLLTTNGISPEKITVGARPYSNFDNSKNLPSGVEIMILAE